MISLGKLTPNGKEVILEEKENGCIECISHCKDDCGYTRVFVNGKHQRLFRYIYEQKYGKIQKGMVIRHKCDNPNCCNIEHLEIGTPYDNVQDMIKRKRDGYHLSKTKIRGELNKNSKLTKEIVKEIYINKGKVKIYCERYNISRSLIWQIRNKRWWSWFTDTLD